MNAIRIAIVAPYDVLKFDNGASARTYKIAKNLSEFGASVCVLHHGKTISSSSTLAFRNFKALSPVKGSSNYLHPLNLSYYHTLIHFLKEFQPTFIQCEQPWSLFSTLLFVRIFGIKIILDEHNVEFYWSLNASRLPLLSPINLFIEKIACSQSSLILVTSQIDKDMLTRLYQLSSDKLFVVPNGSDVRQLSINSDASSQIKVNLKLPLTKKIVFFHGLMSARQNYEAAELIIETIAPQVPEANFVIVGPDPPNWLIDKAKLQKNVRILGCVNNINDHIQASDVCIVPILRGSGTRLKILEYLAAGKPMVSTEIGAQGLPLKSGVHAILCKEVNDEFVSAIRCLLNNSDVRSQLINECRELAETLSWGKIVHNLYDLYLSEAIRSE